MFYLIISISSPIPSHMPGLMSSSIRYIYMPADTHRTDEHKLGLETGIGLRLEIRIRLDENVVLGKG